MAELVWDEDKNAWARGPAIADVPASTATGSATTAEHNTLVQRFNALLAVCRDAGLVAQD